MSFLIAGGALTVVSGLFGMGSAFGALIIAEFFISSMWVQKGLGCSKNGSTTPMKWRLKKRRTVPFKRGSTSGTH